MNAGIPSPGTSDLASMNNNSSLSLHNVCLFPATTPPPPWLDPSFLKPQGSSRATHSKPSHGQLWEPILCLHIARTHPALKVRLSYCWRAPFRPLPNFPAYRMRSALATKVDPGLSTFVCLGHSLGDFEAFPSQRWALVVMWCWNWWDWLWKWHLT